MRVCVIGAGISGLSTAFFLSLDKDIELTLIEANEYPGGKAKTAIESGYIVESGPNGFLDNRPFTLELVKLLSIEDRLLKSSDKTRKRFVYKGGRLIKIPEDALSFLLSQILTFKGKLRVAAEYFVGKKEDDRDESVSSFVTRRLGKEALESLIDPMVAGIFAGDPDKLSIQAAFPPIWQLEKKYGGLIKGLLALKKERGGDVSASPGGTLWSFKGGMSELTKALFEKIEGEKLLGKQVKRILKRGRRFYVEWDNRREAFDAVVVCTPAYSAAKLLSQLDSELSKKLSQIEYSPVAVVAMGFEKRGLGNELDGFGFIVPRSERRKILGVLFDSSIFPNRAPKGKVLLRAMLGGSRQPHLAFLPQKELEKIAYTEAKRILGLRHRPEFVKVFKHSKGIPHYRVGHLERVGEIFKLAQRHGGLFLNSNAYYGVGVNDCVFNAKRTAQKVKEFLEGKGA